MATFKDLPEAIWVDLVAFIACGPAALRPSGNDDPRIFRGLLATTHDASRYDPEHTGDHTIAGLLFTLIELTDDVNQDSQCTLLTPESSVCGALSSLKRKARESVGRLRKYGPYYLSTNASHLGVAAGLALSRFVAGLLYGVQSNSLAIFAASTFILGVVAGIAAFFPALARFPH